MSTSQATSSAQSSGISIASVRILRLALGTALSLWFSQAVGWQMSFIAPVFTLLVLALPLPVLKLKQGIAFVAVLAVALYSGMLLLPMLLEQPAVGLLLLTLALFWSFYFTAKGGSALIGTFATVGLALVAGVGSVNVDALLIVAGDVVFAAAVGVIFVWIAHALMPDSMAFDSVPMPGNKAPEAPQPDLANARWSAFRSLLIVLPVALFLMLSSSSVAYIAVMIKVASMGQQATNDDTRHAGRSLILSTIIGGIGAIIGWEMLSLVPTLTLYTLVVGLAGLIMGPKIFQGAAMHPQGATWSYGYITMVILLAPAVMDSIGGDAASVKFWERIIMFAGATLYAVVAVYIVDAFRPKAEYRNSQVGE
jgi:hypothetical protein